MNNDNMTDFRLQASDFGFQEAESNANPEVLSPKSEALLDPLPPELADFESQLKSLKPVAPRRVAMQFPTISWHDRSANRGQAPALMRRTLLCGLIVAVSLLIAVTWFGLMRLPGSSNSSGNPSPIIPHNSHEIAENTGTKPTITEPQPRPVVTPSAVFRGEPSMRKQLAMLLDEMQPQVAVAIEPKQPDYPVMVIPVGGAVRPLSPEAKQAFQRRLQSRFDPNDLLLLN